MATQPARIGLIVLVAFVSALAGGLVARWLPESSSAGAPAAGPPLPQLAGGTTLSPLVERATPAVVNIAVRQPSPAEQNPLLRDPFHSDQRIAAVIVPLLIMHGARDAVVSVGFGERLFALAHEPKQFVRFAEGGHNDLDNFGAIETARHFMDAPDG